MERTSKVSCVRCWTVAGASVWMMVVIGCGGDDTSAAQGGVGTAGTSALPAQAGTPASGTTAAVPSLGGAGTVASAGNAPHAGSVAAAGTGVAAGGSLATAGTLAIAGSSATAGSLAPGGTGAPTAGRGSVAGSGAAGGNSTGAGGCGGESFAAIYRDIFDNVTASCVGAPCHGRKMMIEGVGNLDMSTPAVAYTALVSKASDSMACSGKPRVKPGDAQNSLLVHKLRDATVDCGSLMPIGGEPITDADLARIVSWINGGACNN